MSLTINQEKQIRALKRANPWITATLKDGIVESKLPFYERLAKNVQLYRRAQKITGAGAAAARQDLIAEIDKCLEVLGL